KRIAASISSTAGAAGLPARSRAIAARMSRCRSRGASSAADASAVGPEAARCRSVRGVSRSPLPRRLTEGNTSGSESAGWGRVRGGGEVGGTRTEERGTAACEAGGRQSRRSGERGPDRLRQAENPGPHRFDRRRKEMLVPTGGDLWLARNQRAEIAIADDA